MILKWYINCIKRFHFQKTLKISDFSKCTHYFTYWKGYKNTGLKVGDLISFFFLKKWHHTWKIYKHYRKLNSPLTCFPEAKSTDTSSWLSFWIFFHIDRNKRYTLKNRLMFCFLMSKMTGCLANWVVKWHHDMKNTWQTLERSANINQSWGP